MSVEDTVPILKNLNELSKILQGESFEEVHRKLIANPLKGREIDVSRRYGFNTKKLE